MNYFDELLTNGPVEKNKRRMPDSMVPLMQRPLFRPNDYNLTEDDAPARSMLPGYESIVDAIDIMLKHLQHYVKPYDTNPMRVWFPFEYMPLKEGDKIFDAQTPTNVYTIKDLDNKYQGVYNLEGNGSAPTKQSILYVSPEDRIRFMVGYPASEDNDTYAETEGWESLKSGTHNPTITYRFIRVEPAGHKDYFSGTRDIGSRFVGSFEYEDGTVATVNSQRFDVELQFSCWMSTNVGAVNLTRWFREAMSIIIPVLRGHGLEHGHFYKQEQDVHLTRWRNDIIARSIVYRFRIGEAKAMKAYILKSLTVRTTVSDDGEIGMEIPLY